MLNKTEKSLIALIFILVFLLGMQAGVKYQANLHWLATPEAK